MPYPIQNILIRNYFTLSTKYCWMSRRHSSFCVVLNVGEKTSRLLSLLWLMYEQFYIMYSL